MEEFKEAFEKMCTENVIEASLFALSALALRHIQKTEEERYNIIKGIIDSKDFDTPEMKRVQDIYSKVGNYDEQLIKCLKDIEVDIAKNLRGEQKQNTNCCTDNKEIEKQRQEIKKWWE
ncbi:hypothetical protein KKC06_06645 [Patescibacteria group bacterium]|nr:hypothetical protein [Patescibacteria group bacterium]